MGKFDGKKLLELGSSVGSVEIVNYAKKEGAYVFVADYLDASASAAKRIADQSIMISTLDTENLVKFCKDKKIDGVICGVSEPNLVSVNKICEELNLNCYFNHKQWNTLEDKIKFKELCVKFNLPIARSFSLEEKNTISFPVIVKPVDRSAAIGIKICNNMAELQKAYQDAKDLSYKKEAIIEEYVVGDEFSAAYTFINGDCRLSSIGDKYLCRTSKNKLPLPEAYIYPSKNIDFFVKNYNENVIEMLKSLGIQNGTAFVQGVTDGEKIVFFEAGLRMGGTALYRFISKINKINILESIVDYSLLGTISKDIDLEDPYFKGKKACILSLLNKGGKIWKILGVEEASKLPGVEETIIRYQIGETVTQESTLKQSHIRFFIISPSISELKKTILKIKNLVHVYNENNEEMIYSNFDVERINS